MGSGFCEFCQMNHSASCNHPGQKQIAQLKERLEAWRKDDIAWDCLAEIASDYYRDSKPDILKFRCSYCHMQKPYHVDRCIVREAEKILQKLKALGEI